LAGLALATGLLASMPVRADIELPSVPPAQPEAVTRKVFIGESVEIPLTGVSRSGGQLQFLIRRQPTAGRLSEITLTSRNTATVTYTHDASAGEGVDHFRYAVRAPDAGFSTPAEVTLNVVPRPPVFVAPPRVDFPATAVGRSAQQTIEIRNDGGSRITGKLTVPEPWSLVKSDGSYSLGPGESKSLTIAFTPTEDRRLGTAGLFSHAAVELGLSGRGYNPIEIVPRAVRLEGDGRSEVRTGGFVLRNVSDEDRELRIAAPPQVIVQDVVSVPAKSETQVAMHTRAGFLGSIDDKLVATGGGVRVEVPLRVMAAPPHVIVHPEAIDFGTLAAGKSGRVTLTMRNIGGSPAALRVKLPSGVTLDPDPSYEALEPSATREFTVSYARAAATKLDDVLTIETGSVPIPVPVRGTVTEAVGNAGVSGQGGLGNAPAALPRTNGLPPVEQIGFTQTKTSLELSWKRTSPDIYRYALFLRDIAFDAKGEPVFKYTALPRVKPRFIRDEVRATLEGLRPGEHITLLVVGYDANGVPTEPSAPFVVFTKPSQPLRIPWFWLGVLGLIGFGIVLVRERWKARADRSGGYVQPHGW
jgi:hypothetical protein